MQGKPKKIKDKIYDLFVNKLRKTNFYQIEVVTLIDKCLKELGDRSIGQIICYGLGSFHNGIDISSRYQLALLILIHEHLTLSSSSLNSVVEIYDPSFKQLDKDTLLTFAHPQFKLITENEYCGRELISYEKNKCVLVYMPHLDKYLYNNLLGVNWSPEGLRHLLILGNSFHEMIDNEISSKHTELLYLKLLVHNFNDSEPNLPSRKSKNKSPKLMSKDGKHNATVISKALIELRVDDGSFEHSDIFNSLAFHFIDGKWLEVNSDKIMQHSIPNWTCEKKCQQDEWS